MQLEGGGTRGTPKSISLDSTWGCPWQATTPPPTMTYAAPIPFSFLPFVFQAWVQLEGGGARGTPKGISLDSTWGCPWQATIPPPTVTYAAPSLSRIFVPTFLVFAFSASARSGLCPSWAPPSRLLASWVLVFVC